MRKISTRIQIMTTTIAALGLATIVASTNTGLAMALSDQDRYDVGHHEGALQASLDEQGGYYNADCQRYDNSHTHTDAYCNGYSVGYDINWHIFKDRNLHLSNFNSNVHSSQSLNQKSQINCFIALCNNHVNQRASQDSSNSINSQN